jgi:hypothetical protein
VDCVNVTDIIVVLSNIFGFPSVFPFFFLSVLLPDPWLSKLRQHDYDVREINALALALASSWGVVNVTYASLVISCVAERTDGQLGRMGAGK